MSDNVEKRFEPDMYIHEDVWIEINVGVSKQHPRVKKCRGLVVCRALGT